MFKGIWCILKKNLKITLRDKGFLIWAIVVPIIWTSLLGFVQENSKNFTINIGIYNLDKGEYGNFILESLRSEKNLRVAIYENSSDLKSAVQNEDVELGVILPEYLTDKLSEGKKVDIYAFTSLSSSSKLAEGEFRKILTRLSINIDSSLQADSIANQMGITDSEEKLKLKKLAFSFSNLYLEKFPTISVEFINAMTSQKAIPQGFTQTSPGFLAMFLMMDLFFASGYFVFEKEKGLFKRLFVFPISKFSVLTGYFLHLFIVGSTQFFILAIFGQFIFSVGYFNNPLIIFSFLVYVFAVSSLSMIVFIFSRKTSEVSVYGIAFSMILSILGGSWWPVEIMPKTMQEISKFTPQYYVLSSFNSVYLLGKGFVDIFKNILVLFLIGVVALIISFIAFLDKRNIGLI